jgi:integrase
MARKKEKLIRTEMVISACGMKFDFAGDVDKELEAAAKAKEMGLISSTAEPKPSSVASKMMFSELFNGFLAYKMDKVEAAKETRKPLSERMQKAYHLYFNTLLVTMGGDLQVSTITRKILRDAILTYSLLPARNKKDYKGVPVSELLKMEIPDEDRIKPKTPLEVKKMVQGIFTYAVEKEIVEVSPANDMKLNLKASGTFARYSKEEVRLLLASSFKEKKLWKKWLPTLAAYTGARRGELVQLRKQDIKFDSDSGRDYILITEEAGDVKNDNAVRKVPLHPALKEVGFLDFVKTVKTTRLFDDLKPQAVTKWFFDYREDLDIERFDDDGDRKVFHSFRHTFITQSMDVSPVHHVQQVVGHEKVFMGQTGRYTHTQPLGTVLGVVDVVNYE